MIGLGGRTKASGEGLMPKDPKGGGKGNSLTPDHSLPKRSWVGMCLRVCPHGRRPRRAPWTVFSRAQDQIGGGGGGWVPGIVKFLPVAIEAGSLRFRN